MNPRPFQAWVVLASSPTDPILAPIKPDGSFHNAQNGSPSPSETPPLAIEAAPSPGWAVGVASSVNHAGFGGGYGGLLAVQLDASARMRLSHGMQLLIGLENAGRARWRSVDQLHAQSPLPSRMRVGLHWRDPRLRLQHWLQLQWEPYHLPDLRYGVDWEAFSEQSTQLNLRAGLTTNTQLSSFYPSMGVGLSHRRLRLNMAAHPHPQLGWSPVIDLAFDR